MGISKEKKQRYVDMVYEEMSNRGIPDEDIPRVIGKTRFLDTLDKYPEEQMHYAIEDAVDEILLMAAQA